MIQEITEDVYNDAHVYSKKDHETTSFVYNGKHYTVIVGFDKGNVVTDYYKCDSHDEIYTLTHMNMDKIYEYIKLYNRKEKLEML